MTTLKKYLFTGYNILFTLLLITLLNNANAQINSTSFATKVDFSIGAGNPSAIGLALKDLNGDGKIDIATVNQSGNQLAILKNTGSNSINNTSFDPATTFSTATTPVDVYADDIDGDGKFDLLVSNIGSNSLSVFRNTSTSGTINFAARVDFSTGTSPAQLVTADLNGDGIKEIINVNFGNNKFSVHRNNSTPGVISIQTPFVEFGATIAQAEARELAVDDMDGDGKLDVVVVYYNGFVSIFRNTSTLSTISFENPINKTGLNLNAGISIADVDLDGKKDILVSAYNNAAVLLYKNNSTVGNINVSNPSTYGLTGASPNPHGNKLKDLDNDNKPELIVCNRGTNTVSIFRNFSSSGAFDANTMSNRVNFTTSTTPISVDFADIDGDGKPEMITANNGGANISVFKNNVKPSNGLVAWYPFNGNAGDSSGFENHGTLGGIGATSPSLTTDRFSNTNSAYLFNSASGTGTGSDAITVPVNVSLRPHNRITIAAWVNTQQKASGFNILLTYRNNTSGAPYNSYYMGSFVGSPYLNKWMTQLSSSLNSLDNEVRTKAPLTNNVWNHIASSYDGTAMRIYVNGILDSSYNINLGNIIYNNLSMHIGNYPSVANTGHFGKIDDLRIYSRALSENEIKALAGLDTTAQLFYNKPSGDLNQLATWGKNTDGSGVTPTSFTDSNVVFNAVNNVAPTLGGSLKITGNKSVLVLGNGTTAFNLVIGANDTLTCDSIYLRDNITVTNSGALLCSKFNAHNNSTVQYIKSSAQTIAAGRYGNLVASSFVKSLTGNTVIKNNFAMLTSIQGNGFSLALGESASQTGTLTRTQGTIEGSFGRWFSVATNSANAGLFPIGNATKYAPFTMEYTSAPITGGFVTCSFITTAAAATGLPLFDFTNGAVFIDKPAVDGYWQLTGTGLSGGTFTATILANNFTGINNFSTLRIIKRPIAGSWTLLGNAGTNTGSNSNATIIRNAITATPYGEYGIGGDQSQNPLPVKLSAFSAKLLSNDKTTLKWQTAQEVNSDYFLVQRSTDAHTWQTRSQVNAKGYSSTTQYYNITDELEQYVGTIYYRLVQVDRNDKKQNSHIVNVTQTKPQEFTIYPNPATNQVFIEGANGETTFYNLTGLPVLVTSKQGWVSLTDLKPGIYFVKNAQKVVKLVVE